MEVELSWKIWVGDSYDQCLMFFTNAIWSSTCISMYRYCFSALLIHYCDLALVFHWPTHFSCFVHPLVGFDSHFVSFSSCSPYGCVLILIVIFLATTNPLLYVMVSVCCVIRMILYCDGYSFG